MTIKHILAATIAAATVGSLVLAPAQAQTPPADMTGTMPSRAAVSTPYSDSYVPRAMRQPKRDARPDTGAVTAAGPILLRLQPMQNLKKRFNDADLDNSGTLDRDEAHQAGLSVVEKNFDNIDTAQRGHVTIDDVSAYLIRRREEANSR